ncbi:hypothetical protein AADZ91_07585 [Colwelliaceae bacterium 6441]
MSKSTNIIILVLALFLLIIGIQSHLNSKPYAELTAIESINGVVSKLHCPKGKGAAALNLVDSSFTYNLSLKFKKDYCNSDNKQPIFGKALAIKALKVSDNYYQIYEIKDNDKVILSPEEVESDRSSSTFGLFLLSFLLVALVTYKNRKQTEIKESQT